MNETTSKTKRLQYVDIARGIAMICIILGHLGNPSINRVVFTFHVPIFFFITGYFTNNKRRFPEFAKNKLRTLIVPYIIACLAIIILGTAWRTSRRCGKRIQRLAVRFSLWRRQLIYRSVHY